MSADDRMGWLDRAVCRGSDTDQFFPGRGEAIAAAKAICAGCPVSVECLDYALDTGQRFGIWGGVSITNERTRLYRQRVAS